MLPFSPKNASRANGSRHGLPMIMSSLPLDVKALISGADITGEKNRCSNDNIR